jgi:glycosyltransferase involved in cell wall biosynthesis
MKVKRVELDIQAFIQAGAEKRAMLFLVGPRPDGAYASRIEALITNHPQVQWGAERVSYDQVPQALAMYDVMLNAYVASLDKSIVEGMMCGVIPIVMTKGLAHGLPEDLRWLVVQDVSEMTISLERILKLSPEQRDKMSKQLREIAIKEHSLENQIQRLKEQF